jgi:hypothetical protein
MFGGGAQPAAAAPASTAFSFEPQGKTLHACGLKLEMRSGNSCDVNAEGCTRRGTAYRCSSGQHDFDCCAACYGKDLLAQQKAATQRSMSLCVLT